MTIIRQTYRIDASPSRVFEALTDSKIIEIWSEAEAKMSAKEGFKFSLWGGSISGNNLVVKPNKKLVQEWFADNRAWQEYIQEGFSSIVIFNLLETEEGATLLELIHEGVPEDDLKATEKGWKKDYLGPLKELVESNPN